MQADADRDGQLNYTELVHIHDLSGVDEHCILGGNRMQAP